MTSRASTASASVALPAPSRPQLLAGSYRVGARILRAVPPGVRYAAATPGGSAWFLLSSAQRRAALENYAAVLGSEPDDPRVAPVARRAFQNYGRMLMDFLLLGSLSPEELGKRMSNDGREHLDAALARGRGVIMAIPHMGSWDMAGSYAASLGYRVWAVAEKFPGSLDDAVVSTRERFGLKVVSLGRSAVRTLNEALRENGIIALVCDLEQGPGVPVQFFGRRAIVPGGPAALALKNGAAIITAAPYAISYGHYHVHLDPPMQVSGDDTREGLMQRVVGRFEDFIRERPDQWYAFRRMFDR
ncbi:MAG TPA: lysophospholipid acyltransferase family protein [Candidatus Dormibacteraeota bacterium]|nr:lysophospholipid acyltransferase family protein [Candidatus Dormibacteraeota bacterium]